MPPRKKEENAEAAEASRRSIRIREQPPKPEPKDPLDKILKRVKKTNPDLAEWKPARKTAGKKRKAGDEEANDGDKAKDGETAAPNGEGPSKKKVKQEEKPPKGKKVAEKAVEKEEAKPTPKPKGRKSEVAAPEKAEGASKKIVIGSVLPTLTLKNEKGEDVEISTLAKDTGVVIFVAPKADTPGCNKQACHFRDTKDDFSKLGYDVYGLTNDTTNALQKWQTKSTLSYSLLSDPERTLIDLLGAKTGTSSKRSHFIFESGSGKLIDAKIGVKPDDSHAQALEFIKKL